MIVWFYSLEDDRENKNLENGIFKDEPTALAMKMFSRVKIDIESVSDRDLKRKYGRTPTFVCLDPNGAELAVVSGKQATSRSRFKGFLEGSWNSLFETDVKKFTKDMREILDRLDKVNGKLTVLNAKKQRLARRPNARKQRELADEEKQLKEEEAVITKDEAEIKKACLLREEFRTPQEPVEK
jgi:hypothetical protein